MAANSNTSAGPPAWRNRKAESEAAPKHRWQTTDPQRSQTPMPGQSPKRAVAMAVLLLGGLVLIGWYVRSLLIAPEQTPMLVVSAGPYPEPFGPNAWSAEDAEGIAQLHDETARVTDARTLQNFDRTLKTLIESQSGAKTVVIVLSMHGGVDDEGRPCLIPPGASPLNTATWIPLRTVLSQIGNEIPARTNKLLILDCNRVRMRWQQGTLLNAFTNRLISSRVVEESKIPNLTVLNSVSPGQRGWASADLNASVFGHYLKRALAGEADKPGEGGDGDRSVSLRELRRFVAHHVDHWVQHHRGERQQPILLRSNADTAEDFHIIWALRGELPALTPADRDVTDDELDKLWDDHDRLRDAAPYAADPRKWAQLQRKLVRLEETAVAGRAYAGQARTLRAEVRGLLKELEGTSGSAWSGLLANQSNGDQTGGVHSLPLAEHLKQIDAGDVQTIRAAWKSFQEDATTASLDQSLRAAESVRTAAEFEGRVLLRMLRKYDVPERWAGSNVAGAVFGNRLRGRRLAAPNDPRVFELVRPEVTSAEADQRLAEDWLFAGVKQVPTDFTKRVDGVRVAYDAAEAAATDAASAYALHDRAFAELPWMAYWLSLPGTLMQADLQDEAVARQVSELVAAVNRFDKALREKKPFDDARNRVANALEVLARKYDDECVLLGEQKADAGAKVLRRIESALAVPLIPGRMRSDFRTTPNTMRRTLRKLRHDIEENLRSTYEPEPASTSSDSIAESQERQLQEVRDALIRFVARWDEHPAVSLLREETAAKKDVAGPDADEMGQTIGKLLLAERRLRERLEAFPDDVKSALAADATNTTAYRARFSAAARIARAGTVVPLPIVEPDPVRQLQRFDAHRILLWHADRALDDFWAGVEPASKQYFERAAGDYVNLSEAVFPATPRKSTAEVRKRIATLKQVAGNGLDVNADSDVQLAADEPLRIRARVMRSELFRSAVTPRSAVPLFLIAGPEGRIRNSMRPVVFSDNEASNEIRVPLSMNDLQRIGAPLHAVAVFRGREYREPFVANTSGGVTIEWKPQKFGDARITLSGDRRKPVSIVFVLDCSQSMKTETAERGGKTRMDVAKDALSAMLDELAKRGNARVGVLFYGHRVGWEAGEGKEILRRKNYPNKIPEGLLPLEDVETVLSLGRFDARIAAGVQRLLKRVQPWGETPLYLSLRQALDQFSGEPSGVEKRIIVITDGINNQRVPDNLTLTKEQQAKVSSLSDVTTELSARKVPVFLLGFEFSGADRQAAKRDFESISSASGGRHFSEVNAKTLLPDLKSLFEPDRFTVSAASGGPLREATLGKSVQVKVGSLNNGLVAVKSGDAEMETPLEGGENLQLLLSADGRSIRTEPYLVGSPKFVPLIKSDTKSTTGEKAGVHSPTRASAGGSSVTFAISLQRDDGGVVDRPADYWVEIVPLNDKGESVGPVYPFFDRRFDVGNPTPPVPVLLCKADGWPKAGVKASLRIIVRSKPADVARRVALKQLLAESSPSQVSYGDSILRADAAVVAGNARLRVVQRAADKSATLSPLKVGLSTAAASPVRIVRRFDAANGLAVHEFYFASDVTKQLPGRELLITGRSQFESGGRQTRNAVIVGVPAQGAVLRLNGPTPAAR